MIRSQHPTRCVTDSLITPLGAVFSFFMPPRTQAIKIAVCVRPGEVETTSRRPRDSALLRATEQGGDYVYALEVPSVTSLTPSILVDDLLRCCSDVFCANQRRGLCTILPFVEATDVGDWRATRAAHDLSLIHI